MIYKHQRPLNDLEKAEHIKKEISYLRAIANYLEDKELNKGVNSVPYPNTDDEYVKETTANTVEMYALPRDEFITWCVSRGLINRPEELY